MVFLPTNGGGKIDVKWQRRLAEKAIGARQAKSKAAALLEEAKRIVEHEVEQQASRQ